MDKTKLIEKIINIIIEFGNGNTEFYTGDIQELLHYVQYLESKVKELKEKADSRDKITIVDDHEADDTKPMIGSCDFPDKSNFISESPSQNSIGSMKSAQKEKTCNHIFNYSLYGKKCEKCGRVYRI